MIHDFYKHKTEYITAQYFVDKYQVSLRTIQSDIKKIREYLSLNEYAQLESKPSQGSKLLIQDEKSFRKIYLFDNTSLESESSRVRKLCLLLLENKHYLLKQQIAQYLYVSISTLTSDLNKLQIMLAPFELTLLRDSHKGVKVAGSEKNIRRCLLKMGILENSQLSNHSNPYRQVIERNLVSVLLQNHIQVSDTLFQNLILHIEISIQRIKKGFSISKADDKLIRQFNTEYLIAEGIFKNLGERFYFKASTGEVLNLAIYLQGKSNYQNSDYISAEIDSFIMTALIEIREKFNIDFTQEIDLRMSLALHIMPLITRIQFNIQNTNILLEQIKQSFPLAFDIAAYMGLLLQQKTGKKVEEGEISYLAIYFNQYLVRYKDSSNSHKVLIITSLKRSESVLLHQRFVTWFSKEISLLTLANIYELEDINIDSYDVIFTTEQTELTDSFGAILISFYPSEADYFKIKLAIDGFKTKQEILNLFSKERFITGSFQSKEEVLKKIVSISAKSAGRYAKQLETAVDLREQLGSSYFGGSVALPHPISPLPVETFVSVILLNHEINWDMDKNKVKLIMLVVIEKNNAKVFQLWNYLGRIVQDNTFIDQLQKKPTFELFMQQLSQVLD